MKFILNKDKVTLEGYFDTNVSGTINYYEIPIEYDETWENLVIKAIIVNKEEDAAEEMSVINDKFFIDKEKSGTYRVGFVGYTIENDEKVYQVSTDLTSFIIDKGAGEIEGVESHDIPTPSEWEIYIAQIQEMIDSIGSETNYNNLQNKPQINNVELTGNKSLHDLGIQPEGDYALQSDIPTDTSDLNNDSGFITNAVDDLLNYTKTSDMNTAISTAVGTETTNRQNSDINLQNQIDAITSSSDVVDIVGTYADLQNYDTTDLGNNDVIKVLQDSTHNDAMTYYRWLKISSTWQYIGQEGPYYTKSETDLKLQNYEEISNKVTSISSSSTDTQYPSAKCVYDLVGNIESILETLDVGGGLSE